MNPRPLGYEADSGSIQPGFVLASNGIATTYTCVVVLFWLG